MALWALAMVLPKPAPILIDIPIDLKVREHINAKVVDDILPAPLNPPVVQPHVAPTTFATPVPVSDPVAPTVPTDLPAGPSVARADPGAGTKSVLTSDIPVDDPPTDPFKFVVVDELPSVITQPKPEYPDIARQANVDGIVVLRALIGVDGHVQDVVVFKSIPMLDSAAMAGVRRWTFTPAVTNGHPVRVWVSVPVRFTLH
jgi:protein TonB